MRRTLVIALFAALLPALAFADEAEDAALLKAATTRVTASWERLRKLPEIKEAEAPQPDKSRTGYVLPGKTELLKKIAPEGFEPSDAKGVTGHLDVGTRQLYVFVIVKEGANPWRGPLRIVTRKEVVRALERHKSDGGEQGFYANRFRKLAKLGPEAAPHMIHIFYNELDDQLRSLSLEALPALGNKSKEILEGLKKIAESGTSLGHRDSAIVALAKLGQRELFDTTVKELKAKGGDLLSTKEVRLASLTRLAQLNSRWQKHDEAIAAYREALAIDDSNAILHYNLGCAYATLKRIDDAFKCLNTAVDKGFRKAPHFEWMKLDGDLKKLRKDPRWKLLMKRQFEKKEGDQ